MNKIVGNFLKPSFQLNYTRGFSNISGANLDWKSLGFSYVPTNSFISADFKDGNWSELKTSDPFIKIHALSNVLHYGQAIFEGLKAFQQKNGDIVIFNPQENAKRMAKSGERLAMPKIPEKLFLDACHKVVQENIEFMPPFGSGGSLYLRPFMFGSGIQLGVRRSSEFKFGVVATPVGLYYPSGLKPVDALISQDFDRAAPKGVGFAKAAGNYAADLVPSEKALEKGFPIVLYLDSKEQKYVEEFGTSNFVAISKDKKKFITCESESILDSITNKMLQQLAKKKGLQVEKRKVKVEEILNGDFSEIAACGTAVIVTPIKSFTMNGKKTEISAKLDVLEDLYNEIREIQTGQSFDAFNWCEKVRL